MGYKGQQGMQQQLHCGPTAAHRNILELNNQHQFKHTKQIILSMQMQTIPTHINVTAKSPAVASKLANLREATMKEHSQLITNEVDKLRQANDKINNILMQTNKNKQQCEQTIVNLQNEINDLDSKIASYQRISGAAGAEETYKNNIKQLNAEYLNTCKERVRLANELNIKQLRKLDIEDKKSPAHDVFKWIMAGIYNEAGNKYFWPNFKEEALENDKGRDLVERLGKVSALDVKQQQKIKTEMFLQNYPTIAAAPELKNSQGEVEKIKQIAELFKRGYGISGSIKENEILIDKHKEQTLEKDEQFMRWKARSQALKDRVQINKHYLQALNTISQKLSPKSQQYSSRLQNGQILRKDFESLNQGTWNPSINLNQDPKGNCQCNSCSIF